MREAHWRVWPIHPFVWTAKIFVALNREDGCFHEQAILYVCYRETTHWWIFRNQCLTGPRTVFTCPGRADRGEESAERIRGYSQVHRCDREG